MTLTRDSLLTLEAYAKIRKAEHARLVAYKRRRAVALGNHLRFLFEDETTIRYQIQEMLHIEKIFEAGIEGELDAYLPLVPDGTNLKATMQIEYEHEIERARARAADWCRGSRVPAGRRACARLRDRRRGSRPRHRREDVGRALRALRLDAPMRAALRGGRHSRSVAITRPTMPPQRVDADVTASLAADLR